MPYIFQFLKNLTIPEVDFDGGWLKNINVNVPQPSTDAVNIGFDNTKNALELICIEATAHLTADFHYTYLFITVDGKADITIKKAALDVAISAGTQAGTPSYELAPKLNADKIDINVNSDDIDVTLTGGLVAKIANILIPLIKSSVIPSLINQVESTATSLINEQLNQDLALYGTQQQIPFLGFDIDYAQVGGPQFTSDKVFQMGLNGTFFDENHAHS